MEVTYEITNEQLFNERVIDVDTTGLFKYKHEYKGTISIETEKDGWVDTTGHHSADDYQDKYGFILKS